MYKKMLLIAALIAPSMAMAQDNTNTPATGAPAAATTPAGKRTPEQRKEARERRKERRERRRERHEHRENKQAAAPVKP